MRPLGHDVSDHVLINRASKERALHQLFKYSRGTNLTDCRPANQDHQVLHRDILNYFLFMLILVSGCYQEFKVVDSRRDFRKVPL